VSICGSPSCPNFGCGELLLTIFSLRPRAAYIGGWRARVLNSEVSVAPYTSVYKSRIQESRTVKLKIPASLVFISALMVACTLCEAAQKEVPRSARHKALNSGHSHAARPYGAGLNEAQSIRALESEISRKLGSTIRESDYPEEARRQGWTGTALVAVLVGSDGKIKETSIYRSSGFPILDQQALRMVDRASIWWMPQRLRKREVKVTVPVGFYIRNA
jgi:TonB family protein